MRDAAQHLGERPAGSCASEDDSWWPRRPRRTPLTPDRDQRDRRSRGHATRERHREERQRRDHVAGAGSSSGRALPDRRTARGTARRSPSATTACRRATAPVRPRHHHGGRQCRPARSVREQQAVRRRRTSRRSRASPEPSSRRSARGSRRRVVGVRGAPRLRRTRRVWYQREHRQRQRPRRARTSRRARGTATSTTTSEHDEHDRRLVLRDARSRPPSAPAPTSRPRRRAARVEHDPRAERGAARRGRAVQITPCGSIIEHTPSPTADASAGTGGAYRARDEEHQHDQRDERQERRPERHPPRARGSPCWRQV